MESAQNQLVPCSKCGRTFAHDRVDIHERSCKATGGGPPSKIPVAKPSKHILNSCALFFDF